MAQPPRRVELDRSGLRVDGDVVPLLAGSIHYFRHPPADWRACLAAVRELGFRMVDVYVPWAVHEIEAGRFDFGESDRRLGVSAFLKQAQALGLLAIVRPGPHINAELTCFGIPERVIWDPACQAKSPRGNPVVLPALPRMFPVPSYASEAFHDEAARWLAAVGEHLAPLAHPQGPIVLLQIDNEGALYFRDGPFDQDYHPDAVALYRSFLRQKYGTLEALQEAYGSAEVRFAELDPPRKLEATRASELARYLDWMELQEELVPAALARFSAILGGAGLDGLPTTHNFPLAHETTPLDAARVGAVVDLVGHDYYYRAGVAQRAEVARRTGELSQLCAAHDKPAFAPEMGAGFPPFFSPISERDSAFTVLTALAYGLKGFNAYMAVERDRWIGAPIDVRGRARPFAGFWRRLCEAIEQTGLHRLVRRAPVRLLLPRLERRLVRLLHAFGPLSPALMAVMGRAARDRALEEELDVGHSLADAETFAHAFEQALDARGVAFAWCDGGDREALEQGARWIVCASSGGLTRELRAVLDHGLGSGMRVTVGPHPIAYDGAMKPLAGPALDGAEQLMVADPAAVDRAVARAVEELGLPSVACDPDGVHATVHEDDDGRARVTFAINASERDVVARIGLGVDARWEDALDGGGADSEGGVLEIRLLPWTVRMLVRG